MWGWPLVVLGAAACNAVYGIKPTELIDAQPREIDARVCPVPDEDGDCVADASDNCPGLANEGQDDSDGDGIGDVCDPNPGTHDRLLTFIGFNDPDDLARFVGHWTIDTERGVVVAPADNTPLRELLLRSPTDLTVEAGYTFHSSDAVVPNRLGILLDVDSMAMAHEACEIDAFFAQTIVEDPFGTVSGAQQITPPVDGTAYTMQFQRSPTEVTCTVVTNNVAAPQIGVMAAAGPAGYVAFTSAGTEADLRYVAVYASP